MAQPRSILDGDPKDLYSRGALKYFRELWTHKYPMNTTWASLKESIGKCLQSMLQISHLNLFFGMESSSHGMS